MCGNWHTLEVSGIQWLKNNIPHIVTHVVEGYWLIENVTTDHLGDDAKELLEECLVGILW